MKYKDGVILAMKIVKDGNVINAYPSDEIVHAMTTADKISEELTKKEAVITSLCGEKHMEGSKHYPDSEGKVNAFDLRTWIYSDNECNMILSVLMAKLGNSYDVVDERLDKHGNPSKKPHIHIEYDPK